MTEAPDQNFPTLPADVPQSHLTAVLAILGPNSVHSPAAAPRSWHTDLPSAVQMASKAVPFIPLRGLKEKHWQQLLSPHTSCMWQERITVRHLTCPAAAKGHLKWNQDLGSCRSISWAGDLQLGVSWADTTTHLFSPHLHRAVAWVWMRQVKGGADHTAGRQQQQFPPHTWPNTETFETCDSFCILAAIYLPSF